MIIEQKKPYSTINGNKVFLKDIFREVRISELPQHPFPTMTYFLVVNAGNPIGPLTCSFCVKIPIPAPKSLLPHL